jgi:preprotein translocase subunit YajC
MAPFVYLYELRRGEEVVATGRLTQERAIEVGERIVIGGLVGIVREIEPVPSELEFRLLVQLWRDGVDS